MIAHNDCQICMGTGRICTGISFPPGSTYLVKCEYEPCPECNEPPHSFHAKRTAQILRETRERRIANEVQG
jgi:hypothetical protein